MSDTQAAGTAAHTLTGSAVTNRRTLTVRFDPPVRVVTDEEKAWVRRVKPAQWA